MRLYDYIYVDLEKIISLYSQLTGGVVELREQSRSREKADDNKRSYDFKVFKHDAGGTSQDSENVSETIKPHHALLTELEELLCRDGYLVDIGPHTTLPPLSDSDLRARLRNAMCLRVQGRAVIEDYERIKAVSLVFPDISEFINKSSESRLKKSDEYIRLKNQIDEHRRDLKQTKDRNRRVQNEEKLRLAQKALEKSLSDRGNAPIDKWILDGLKTWIDAFLPGIVNLRLYPESGSPNEHVFGHLRRSCFLDADSASFHFSYGSMPTENWTMLGIITSVPRAEDDEFRPLQEFENREDLENFENIEKVFRGLFRGFDGFEKMIRTCRYPRVLVYPLLVYRSVEPQVTNHNQQ